MHEVAVLRRPQTPQAVPVLWLPVLAASVLAAGAGSQCAAWQVHLFGASLVAYAPMSAA